MIGVMAVFEVHMAWNTKIIIFTHRACDKVGLLKC
jgi:hypothetical protein